MPLVAQLVVPGAGPLSQALSTAGELCSNMNELRFVCGCLHSRLENLLGELQLMECKGRLLSTHSLSKYTAVVSGFLSFLEQYSGKDLVYRVVRHKTMTSELKDFHDSVSVLLFELLDVTAIDEWEDDRHVLDAVLTSAIKDERSVMRDLQSPRAQLEALLTLKFEVEKQTAQHEEADEVAA